MEIHEGKVYLVGAGPGAAGLLTLRASRILEKADVVVYDRLVLPRILNFANQTAKFIYVGKQPEKHIATQQQIEELLVQYAKEGKQVVRLKGGDPFVFGRGGEEAQTLAGHDIPWEVVPGVTSAIAVPAYAGIPVTHRNYGAMFTVVSGHLASEDIRSAASQVAANAGTIVILMGVSQLESIVQDLITAGIEASTPVAFIRNGTWGNHRVLTATLVSIAEEVKRAGFESPAVIVVGKTVALRDSLEWFERLPLFGRKLIVAADTVEEAMNTANELESLGAEVFDFALERQVVSTVHVFDPLRKALLQKVPVCVFLETVFGACELIQLFRQNQIDIRKLTNLWIAAKDDVVNQTLLEAGFGSDFIGRLPTHYFTRGASFGSNIGTWLQSLDENSKMKQVLALYELPPIGNRSNEKNIEQMLHYFIPNASVVLTPFYGLSYESESVFALVRTLQPFETEPHILSETAFHVLHEIVSRKGMDIKEYLVHLDEMRAI